MKLRVSSDTEQAAVAFRRRKDDTERRIAKAHQLVQMGEISFAVGHEGHPRHNKGSIQKTRLPDIPAKSAFEFAQPSDVSGSDTHLLFRAGELLARAQVPHTIVDTIRVGKLTALSVASEESLQEI